MTTTTHYDFLVFIGRFQPFHAGHQSVIKQALGQTNQLIILCGSAHQPRTARNPWSVPEREAMIRATLPPQESHRVHIAPLMDIVYNDESWVRNVQATVNGIVTAHFATPHKKPKVGLIGHSKDQSSYYLNLFPQWSSVNVPNHQGISATPIRDTLFSALRTDQAISNFGETLPIPVAQLIQEFCNSEVFTSLRKEYEFIHRYKEAWKAAPYAPTFVTVDAVVVQSGHVLMVERKARPGKGLLALPGGFVNPEERLVDACLRELREETRLKVPAPVLKGSIKAQRVFDDPFRSERGRTITHACYLELQPNKELPRVKGSDDAKRAMWIALADLDPTQIYEDHYFIIQELTGL